MSSYSSSSSYKNSQALRSFRKVFFLEERFATRAVGWFQSQRIEHPHVIHPTGVRFTGKSTARRKAVSKAHSSAAPLYMLIGFVATRVGVTERHVRARRLIATFGCAEVRLLAVIRSLSCAVRGNRATVVRGHEGQCSKRQR